MKTLRFILLAFPKTAGKNISPESGREIKKAATPEKNTERKIDLSSSKIYWKGSGAAGTHAGTVNLKDGKLDIENDKIRGGYAIVDMKSIVCEEKNKEMGHILKKHLDGADFFDVEKYPEAKFEITSVTSENNQLEITGDLTLKDVTRRITFPAGVSRSGQKITYKAPGFIIDRTQWGIHFGSINYFKHLADSFINDDIEIRLVIDTV